MPGDVQVLTIDEIHAMDGHIDTMGNHTKSVVLGFGPLCNLSDHVSNLMPHIDFGGSGSSLESFFAGFSEKMSSCLTTVKGWWTSAKNWFLELFAKIASDPSDTESPGKLARAWAAVQDFFSPVMDAFKWVADTATKIVSSVGSAIVGAFDDVKLASCQDFKNANVDPTFISTDSPLAAAKASEGKSKEQIMQDHMVSTDASDECLKAAEQKALWEETLRRIPPNLAEI